MSFNPFEAGQGLSTVYESQFGKLLMSQSLWNRAGSFDSLFPLRSLLTRRSQSLWNRAGSFDLKQKHWVIKTLRSQSLWNRAGSFDSSSDFVKLQRACLNPFGTGRGLSTKQKEQRNILLVSIPLEQGGVFRQI